MPGVESGAVYVPGFLSEGRPVAGPDEDVFTLGATAWEGLGPLPPGSPAPRSVHLVGPFPRTVDWGLGALFGHPVDLHTHPAGLPGLSEALADVETAAPDGLSQLILAVQIPERSGPEPSADLGVGAGAVALRFGPAGSLSGAERSMLLEGPDVVSAARVVLAARGIHPRPAFAPRGLSLGSVRPFVEAPLTTVSEGAYVPRARYLEDLPSRWRLEAERCGHCGTLTFPARGVCRSCHAREGLLPHPLPRDGGMVVAVTTIGQGGQPTEFDPQVAALGEYSVALVELVPGVRSTLQVTDASPGEVHIGSRVATRLRRLYPMEGEWRYGRKAVPLAYPPGEAVAGTGGSQGAPTQTA